MQRRWTGPRRPTYPTTAIGKTATPTMPPLRPPMSGSPAARREKSETSWVVRIAGAMCRSVMSSAPGIPPSADRRQRRVPLAPPNKDHAKGTGHRRRAARRAAPGCSMLVFIPCACRIKSRSSPAGGVAGSPATVSSPMADGSGRHSPLAATRRRVRPARSIAKAVAGVEHAPAFATTNAHGAAGAVAKTKANAPRGTCRSAAA